MNNGKTSTGKNHQSNKDSKNSKNGKNGKIGKNGKPQVKVLGPVRDLEEHVPTDWWRRIFTSLYLKTDGDVVDDQKITRYEVDLFSSILKLQPDDKILDLCCGQGRHSLELARRGYKSVEGLDRSHYLIQRAKEQAKKEGLGVRFREGDARKLPYPPDSFDVVMILGNSFGYFETVHDDMRVLREVFRVLKPWGKLLIDVADGDYMREHFQPRSWEWIDKKHFVNRERSLSADGQRLISREIIMNTEKGAVADQFYAERLYNKENLNNILQQAGLSDIAIHGELSSDSQRKQDLGMMEKRIIVTAVVKKEWTPVRRKPKGELRTVVVITGDPTKPDRLKPGAVFDEDDIYTIDQMKDALREMEGYNFIYLSNHDTLIQDLIKLKPKIDYVFNLCDEGFGNDPRKELHIPALLEELQIPYTGSGPQALAHCYDKSLVRGMANEMGIPVPDAILIKPEDKTVDLTFSFPALVKPNFGDSSFGITQRCVVNSSEELLNAVSEIREKFGYNKPILVEEFLSGKDISVGIIGNAPESYTVLPITEEDYSCLPEGCPHICGYEAKWLPDSPYWNIKSIPAELPPETRNLIIKGCLVLFERLEIRDYCRFDWRFDARGNPKLLEVNPNPGWCWDGHLAKMSKFAGMSYAEMLEAIIKAAEQRLGLQPLNGKVEEQAPGKIEEPEEAKETQSVPTIN
ncbi:MAG: methyltransferase domain-containing protein [Candidatus Jordarchaeum sp.]|uniref:methyltransferase domain-containing protein n=1 Tax=Candidatus Jordarchaeum sp. TaxID=2823881 RepID=UPI00404A122E